MLLHVYVLVYVLGFVIVLFQSGVLEHVLFCVRLVVATSVCLVDDVLDFVIVLFQSEWWFRIHIGFTVVGGGGLLCIFICKTF